MVSLKQDTERRAALQTRLDALGISFEFVDAFDARTDLDTLNAAQVNRDPNLHISVPEYGCALSHAFLYQRIVQEQLPHALILEDDALPLPQLATFLERRCYEQAPFMMLYHGRAYVKPNISIPLFDDVVARPLNLNCSHTVAYTLNLHAATVLKDATTPVQALADWPTDIAALNACIVRPVLVQHPPDEQGSGLASVRQRKPKTLKRYLTRAHYRRKRLRRQSIRIEPQTLNASDESENL